MCFFMNFFQFLLTFLGLWTVSETILCPELNSPSHGSVTCRLKKATASCSESSSGVVATFACENFYALDGVAEIKCLRIGSWSSPPPACVLDCGKRSSSVGLIVNGVNVSPRASPWHVAIYNFIDKKYEYWCGGSLISEHAVITAAHCVWRILPNNVMVISGKTFREFKRNEKSLQKRKARKIEMLSSYQDVDGNYGGDVAVIFLEGSFSFNYVTAPVCFDWGQRLTEKQLTAGSFGVVVGWGLTENDTYSDQLRMSNLAVVSDEQCLRKVEDDFKKFITYTSFCAGFANGTGVCNGDSGGGMVFFDRESGRWYLQGLVSVSPRRKGTPFCDTHYYAVFTKVAVFSKWLQRVMNKYSTNQLRGNSNKTEKPKLRKKPYRDLYSYVRKYFEENTQEVKHVKTAFPHTKKMLQWALPFK